MEYLWIPKNQPPYFVTSLEDQYLFVSQEKIIKGEESSLFEY